MSINNYPEAASFNGYKVKDAQGRADIARLDAALNVERARIDEFETLPEGSNTGDAETRDIRVRYDGETESTAGNAVRNQIAELHGITNEISENLEILEETLTNEQYFALEKTERPFFRL